MPFTFWSLKKYYVRCAILGKTRKNWLNFFIGKIDFFWKIVSIYLVGAKKWSFNLHTSCQNNLWTQLICFWQFWYSIEREKFGRNISFTGEDFLKKKRCFYRQLRFYGNGYISKIIIIKKNPVLYSNRFFDVSHTRSYEKKGLKKYPRERWIFFKNVCFR